jgi:hypothetical protein
MPIGQCNVVAYGFGIENGVDQKDRGGIGGIFFLSDSCPKTGSFITSIRAWSDS